MVSCTSGPSRRELMATRAPCRANSNAMPRPIPLLPPVTSAVCPASVIAAVSFVPVSDGGFVHLDAGDEADHIVHRCVPGDQAPGYPAMPQDDDAVGHVEHVRHVVADKDH